MPILQKAYPYLIVLSETKNPAVKKELLKNKYVILALSELLLNLVNNHVELKEKDKKKVKRFQKELLVLVKKGSYKEKLRVLSTVHSFLQTLLAVGLPIFAELCKTQSTKEPRNSPSLTPPS